MSDSKLKQIIKDHKKVFAVYGLGNVGGSIAAVWLRAGAKVIGVDISQSLLSAIKSGTSHKKEPYVSETFSKALKNKSLELTTDGVYASKKSDIKIIVVPVPLDKNKVDLRAVIQVANNIARGLKKGDTVILSPSVPPGTTQNVVLPILEKHSKLKAERDFLIIYNPERIFEGRAIADIEENYQAVIAGLGKKSLKFAEELFAIISKKGVLKLSALATAEAEKLFEGVYRDVNIALANELAEYCEKIGISYWEARKGANSQPFCHLHYPGTGVGGLCIPVYPRIIIEDSAKAGKPLKMLEYSRKINDGMPKKCVSDSLKLLTKRKGRRKVAVLGLGFRGEVTDTRLSPTYVVVDEFLKKGFEVSVHDPFILEDPDLPKNVLLSSDLKKVTRGADLIFVSSDHKMYANLRSASFSNAKKPLAIFDGRNILNKEGLKGASLLTIGTG